MRLFGKVKKGFKLVINEEIAKKINNDTKGELREEIFYVVGVKYYENNIKKLAIANPDYKNCIKKNLPDMEEGRRFFRYNYINKPVRLVPEPRNPHDKNAVMVQIAGEKVGYISVDENRHILNILKKGDIKFISSFISGGQYKFVSGGEIFRSENTIRINIKIRYTM